MSLLATLTAYLPPHEGLLPKWLLLVSIISVANSIQAYSTLKFTQQVYSGPSPSPSHPRKTPSSITNNSPATPLSSRTFGTWTLIQSMVRLYAAYHINESAWYQLAFLTYAVAWGHFVSEWLVFGSTHWGRGLAGPVFVATGTLGWMWFVWGSYVQWDG